MASTSKLAEQKSKEMSADELIAAKKAASAEGAGTTELAAATGGEPSEISWKIICYMYAVGFAISIILGAVQLSGVAPTLEGSWLIFVPFGPCLVYAVTRHMQQQRLQQKPKAD